MFQRKILMTHKEKYNNATIYSKQLPTAGKRKKDKHNICESRTTTWWRMEERLEDGSRRQRGFTLRRSSNTNTEVLKSFRWPHTRVVTTTSYIQTSTTFNRHQSQLPLTFKTFNTFYSDFHFTSHWLTNDLYAWPLPATPRVKVEVTWYTTRRDIRPPPRWRSDVDLCLIGVATSLQR